MHFNWYVVLCWLVISIYKTHVITPLYVLNLDIVKMRLTFNVGVLVDVGDSKVYSEAVDATDFSCRSTNKTLESNTSTTTARGTLMALDWGSITHQISNSHLHSTHHTS
jgi:hypothetical protein